MSKSPRFPKPSKRPWKTAWRSDEKDVRIFLAMYVRMLGAGGRHRSMGGVEWLSSPSWQNFCWPFS